MPCSLVLAQFDVLLEAVQVQSTTGTPTFEVHPLYIGDGLFGIQ